MNLTLGTFIAALRKEKGLTQRELAEMLCVSDKTVSHWERDETSPDISLLPVIAETFGITVDELLKGERNHKETTEPEVKHDKNTGILYALDIAFNKFKTRNYISIALSVISVICGSIVSYFKSVDAGYLVFIALLIVPVLLTALFRGGFNSSLVSPYADKEVLRNYGKKANRITLCNLYFSLLCFILYSARMLLFYTADIILFLLIFLFSGALVYLCEKILRKKDLVSHSDKPLTIKKKTLLKIFSCLLCAVMIFTVYVSHISRDEDSIMLEKAEYTLVAEEDFIALMEKETPAPDEIYGRHDGRFDLYTELSPSEKGTEYTFYPDLGYDDTVIESLDPDGDGGVTFTYNNLEIARYSYHHDEGFAVYTHAQLIKARAEAQKAYAIYTIIHLVLYPATVLISVGIYFILKRLFLKNNKSENIAVKLF
ncbi:MAG: helix-turn-helix transcriptional regulator [Clostridia bacterium]|nr:helix-turn-helix transcriptional regulator [Clostridia bacterium]